MQELEGDSGGVGVSTQEMVASASPPPAALGLTGAMVPYAAGGTVEEDAVSRFRRGDEVRFRVRCHFFLPFPFLVSPFLICPLRRRSYGGEGVTIRHRMMGG